jgi:beta-lactamase regulating signal transducer with metallopeptidase domain
MNRAIWTLAGIFSASSLLLIDSAIKGMALLSLAAVVVASLRRDSAATRHFVWVLAIVAMLVVPVLSAILPQWRVLPEWLGRSPETVGVHISPHPTVRPAVGAVDIAPHAKPAEDESPPALEYRPAAERPTPRLVGTTPAPLPAPNASNRTLLSSLPFVWAMGCCMLSLRLLAARWMLWTTERQATIIRCSRRPTNATGDPITTALDATSLQLGIRRPVDLLIHPDKTIPVVWGVLRCRLLLPAAARHWSAEQLRSVLLHELAHVKRHDAMAQLLAQIACALHWFNPLVWFAAWRLGVECEQACDDLVLASGVRPSTYAGHLLEAVTGLAPTRWTGSSGLAMARSSALEGRLIAILSEKLNRRCVSAALAAIALAIAVGIAVPIAMLGAAEERTGAPMKDQDSKTQAQAKGQSQKPNDGAKLKPGTENKLEWGKPVNGLRMALCWPPVLDEPAAGDVPDLHLAVQNVSKASIRLCTTAEATQQRRLTHKSGGKIQFRIVDDKPAAIDCTLRPREAVFLRLFAGEEKPSAVPPGSEIAAGVRRIAEYSLMADMEISRAPAGAWTGKLATPDTRAGVGVAAPKNRKAQELFKVWLQHTRVNGKIPGGLISRVGERVQQFVKANASDRAGAPYAKRMEPLLPRLDGTRDWQPAQAAALLNDIAAVSDAPLSLALEEIAGGTIQYGLHLKPQMENAPWGDPLSNGLRTAWLLEPRAPEYRLGTPLKCRILVHNAGTEPVVFRTRSWHHIEPTAKDAKGAPIGMETVTRFTRAPLVTYRLEPGRYVELATPGFGLGKYGYHDFKDADIASWIGAKEGDEVTLTPGVVPLNDWNEAAVLDGEPRWWLDFIMARLNLATPLPTDAAERRALLNKVMADITLMHTRPTEEEIAAFVADTSPRALANLAERIFHRPGLHAWAGPLQSGSTKFRVAGADPRGAKPAAAPAATPPSPAPAEKPKSDRASKTQGPMTKRKDA